MRKDPRITEKINKLLADFWRPRIRKELDYLFNTVPGTFPAKRLASLDIDALTDTQVDELWREWCKSSPE